MTTEKFSAPHKYWQNWATKIVDGLSCQSFAEEAIQDYWYPYEWWNKPNHPCLFNIGGDPYDHSLELDVAYIDTQEKALEFFNKKVTQELVDFIAQNGVNGFWINFYATENRNSKKKYEIAVWGEYKNLILKLDEQGNHVHDILQVEKLT